MATETQIPDAVLASTNFTGSVSDIQDDPDAPDGNWLVATSITLPSSVRVSFPTPSGSLIPGLGLQEFRVLVAQTTPSNSGIPSVHLELWYNGALVYADTTVNVLGAGQIVSMVGDAASLPDLSGIGVECRVVTNPIGGAPSTRNNVDIGAIEWNLQYLETQPLFPPTLEFLNGVYTPTILPGTVTLAIPLLSSTTQVFTPRVAEPDSIIPPTVESPTVVYAPVLHYIVTVPKLGSSLTLYTPGVFRDLNTVVPPLLTNGITVYAASLNANIVYLENFIVECTCERLIVGIRCT